MTIRRIRKGGKYFYARDDELEALFAHKKWDGETIEVVKEGSNEGRKIIAWKRADGSHGRRNPISDASASDWSVGDKIMLKACAMGNYLMKITMKEYILCIMIISLINFLELFLCFLSFIIV